MFRKILLGYDGSKNTEAALKSATELAIMCDAELHIIGIAKTELPSAPYAEPYAYDFLTNEKINIERALADASGELKDKGLEIVTLAQEGNPAHEIASYAQTIQADLVVIGHVDRGFLARWFEGSVGAELLRHLPCSLLIATDS